MADELVTPFDRLDSAHQYICLLCESLKEARHGVEEDIAAAASGDATRQLDALRLVSYKLDRLESNLDNSRRLLHDLQKLRRLLLGEPG